ncbi:hypothetical protein D3C73_1346840 [compost metagenome]
MHALAVDEHDGRFPGGKRQVAVLAHRLVEQRGRVGGIKLIDVVIQRATVAPRQVRDSEAIIGEAGTPARLGESGQARHPVNLITPVRVSHLLQGKDKHALGSVLSRFGTQEYAHGGSVRGSGSGCQDDRLDVGNRDVFADVP